MLTVDDLLCCPFCGGDAILKTNYSNHTCTWFVFAKCCICNAQGKTYASVNHPGVDNWENEACDNAVRAWNTRA